MWSTKPLELFSLCPLLQVTPVSGSGCDCEPVKSDKKRIVRGWNWTQTPKFGCCPQAQKNQKHSNCTCRANSSNKESWGWSDWPSSTLNHLNEIGCSSSEVVQNVFLRQWHPTIPHAEVLRRVTKSEDSLDTLRWMVERGRTSKESTQELQKELQECTAKDLATFEPVM